MHAQAVGRVIRHRADWGAVVLLDARLCKPSAQAQVSKWLAQAVNTYPSYAAATDSLKAFYARMLAAPPQATLPTLPPLAPQAAVSEEAQRAGAEKAAAAACDDAKACEEVKAKAQAMKDGELHACMHIYAWIYPARACISSPCVWEHTRLPARLAALACLTAACSDAVHLPCTAPVATTSCAAHSWQLRSGRCLPRVLQAGCGRKA